MPDPEHNISCGRFNRWHCYESESHRPDWFDGPNRFIEFSTPDLVGHDDFFEFYYSPSSHSRKAIYMTFASLGFLILALVGALSTSHGGVNRETSRKVVPSDKQLIFLYEEADRGHSHGGMQ